MIVVIFARYEVLCVSSPRSMYKYLGEHHVQIFFTLTGQQRVPPRKSTLTTLHKGFCGTSSGTSWLIKVIKFGGFLTTLEVRLTLIESPDLQVEVWVKPQEVSSFVMVMVFLNSTCPRFQHEQDTLGRQGLGICLEGD